MDLKKEVAYRYLVSGIAHIIISHNIHPSDNSDIIYYHLREYPLIKSNFTLFENQQYNLKFIKKLYEKAYNLGPDTLGKFVFQKAGKQIVGAHIIISPMVPCI